MRLLCIPYSPTLSHVSRLLSLAVPLRSCGVPVVFAGSGKEMRHVEAEGFRSTDLWEVPADELLGAIRARRLNFVSREALRRMVAADLDLFERLRPTAVLSDGRFSAPISTRVAGVRHGAIVNASSTRFRHFPYMPFFAAPGARLPLLRPALVRLECALFDLLMRTFYHVAKEFGVPGATTPTDCLTGNDLTLIPDLPEFFPTRTLPNNHRYVGPLTWQPSADASKKLEVPHNNSTVPLVYLTLGTTGDGEFLRTVRDLLATSPYRAVITTAGQAPGLESIPGKIWVTDYADGDELCRQAEVVLCHGGNGTIYQALRHARPIIGVPFIPDQEYNLRRVTALGLGRKINLHDYQKRPECLLEAIDQQLSDRATRERCHQFRQQIVSMSPAERGAELVTHYLLR